MKIVASLMVCLLMLPFAAGAESIADRTTLAQAANDSAYVVVATAKSVAVVKLYNSLLYRLNPEPLYLTSYTAAQLELTVDEVLYPAHWQPKKPIKFLFSDSLFTVAQIRSDTAGRRMIFVMNSPADAKINDRSQIFMSAAKGLIAFPFAERSKMKELIEQRIKRESVGRSALSKNQTP